MGSQPHLRHSAFKKSCDELTHLSQTIFPTSPFPILRVMGVTFHILSNSNRTFYEQTVENLINHRVLRRLIWVCTVCLCPTKKEARLIVVNRTQLE